MWLTGEAKVFTCGFRLARLIYDVQSLIAIILLMNLNWMPAIARERAAVHSN
jgi:hypothetical protein